LDFGPVDNTMMRNPSEMVLISVPVDNSGNNYHNWWFNYINGLMYGDDLTIEYELTNYPAITDTGSACLSIPTTIFTAIKTKIVSRLTSFTLDAQNNHKFVCADNLPKMVSFYIKFGTYWV
jgi:hypothetical protein